MGNQPFGIEMQTVGMMLWNPTNETFDMQYAGISIAMEPGEKQIFAIKCATHLLNGYGQRGLTSLVYGADEEKVGADAKSRNLAFKKKQVVEYNQRNEHRKASGMGYLPPTEEVKKYALELGLKLLEPYTVRDEEREKISETANENAALKAEVAELKAMMQQFMASQSEPKQKTEVRRRVDGKWVKNES